MSATAGYINSVQSENLSAQVMLRIAIHRSFQAQLHCLQRMCADEFIGDETDEERLNKTWQEVYRALRHDVIRRSCQDDDSQHFRPEFRALARGNYSLQQARFSANYDSITVVNHRQVKKPVMLANGCITTIENARGKDRPAFAAWIMFDETGGVKDARSWAKSIDPTALFLRKKKVI